MNLFVFVVIILSWIAIIILFIYLFYSFIFSTCNNLINSLTLWGKVGDCTLDGTPDHLRIPVIHIHTPVCSWGKFQVASLPTCMFWTVGGNWRIQRKHTQTRGYDIKCHTDNNLSFPTALTRDDVGIPQNIKLFNKMLAWPKTSGQNNAF